MEEGKHLLKQSCNKMYYGMTNNEYCGAAYGSARILSEEHLRCVITPIRNLAPHLFLCLSFVKWKQQRAAKWTPTLFAKMRLVTW